MPGTVESSIRKKLNQGLGKIANLSRTHAVNKNGPHPFLTGTHTPLQQELELTNLAATGAIPPELNGLYLRNGPNPIGAPNPARYHWFTGDGMVHGLRIAGGKPLWYRNKWVRSSAVSAALGEPPAPGPRLAEAAVNTNIIGHAGQIWALVEAGGTPVRLNGALETLAHDNFGGTLRGAFSAHPHRCPTTGALHAICYHATNFNQVYHVVVDHTGKVTREELIAVHHGPSIHDCAITQNYVLVFDLPVTFSMRALLEGYEFPYRWNRQHPARVGLLAKDAPGAAIIWCALDPCYLYHVANAFETGDGSVMVDVSAHNCSAYRDYRGPDGEDIKFERWVINPVTRLVTRHILDDEAVEFPRIDQRREGLPYRYAYGVLLDRANRFADGGSVLLKHDVASGEVARHDFGPDCSIGEFVFVPRTPEAAEDDGFLLGYVIRGASKTTDLVILSARDVAGAPLASICVPHIIPPGFHGNWLADGEFSP